MTVALGKLTIVGFAALSFFIVSVFLPIVEPGNRETLALALGAGLVNVGEPVFFQVNGAGLLMWLLVGSSREFSCPPQAPHAREANARGERG